MHGRRTFLSRMPFVSALAAPARPAQSQSLRGRLEAALSELEIVNTHEHIIPEKERTSQHMDFFTLAGHYAIDDVISAGLSRDDAKLVADQSVPDAERWRRFEPFWKAARFTGYCQALNIAVRDLYGADEISGTTLAKINDAIRARNKPGLYRHVLKERAHIRFSVVDQYWAPVPERPDPEFFVLAQKFDGFVAPVRRTNVETLGRQEDITIGNLQALKQALEKRFQRALEAGMVTVKTTIAYNRDLMFREVSVADAERDFERLMQDAGGTPQGFHAYTERPYRILEDHMFHHLVKVADSNNIPMQIHTGLHAGTGNYLNNSNPTLLTNLFFLFPRVKFDLFHISYPYQGELSVLAKIFPNVHVDFCWAWIVSPGAARRALHDFLETVPANKIFGFGGDYRYPELTYGHARMARQNIAQVLAEKTEAGFCSEDEALKLGRMVLAENPAHLFSARQNSSSL
jgi:uncharacterized protein